MSTLSPRHVHTCRVLLAILLINWSGLSAYISYAQDVTDSPIGEPSPASPQQAAKSQAPSNAKSAQQLEKVFSQMERVARDVPRESFDPVAIVNQVGKDPNSLFEWVRDKTFWVPYVGELKGAQGVLMDRLGNSLDRSLLLCELLRIAGLKARLARGKMSPDQAKAVLPQLAEMPITRPAVADTTIKPTPSNSSMAFLQETGFDLQQLRRRHDRRANSLAKAQQEVARRAANQAVALTREVGTGTDSAADEAEQTTAALCDHWWVQRYDGTEWVDFDPLLPRAKVGERLISAARTIELDGKTAAFPLDKTSRHEVDVQVRVECLHDGVLKEQQVLKETIRPADAIGQRIALLHVPTNGSIEKSATAQADTSDAMLARKTEWLPVLNIGARRVVQKSFTEEGDINATPSAPLLGSGAQSLGRNLGGILGGRRDISAPGKPSCLTAEWIDYTVRSPGKPPRTIRRQVFDLLGPAARSGRRSDIDPPSQSTRINRALRLLGETEILIVGCQPSPQFVANEAVQALVINGPSALALLRSPPHDIKEFANRMSKARLVPERTLTLALSRFRWSPVAGDVYLESPNVLSYHHFFQKDRAGAYIAHNSFDIVDNHVAVRRGTKTATFVVRMQQGVVDTNCEALLLSTDTPANNASDLMEVSMGKIPWIALKDKQDLAGDLKIGEDAKALIAAELASGFTVVVANQNLSTDSYTPTAWWSVNRLTGDTLGIGENGHGTAEESSMTGKVLMGGIFALGLCALQKMDSKLELGSPKQIKQQNICLLGVGIHMLLGGVSEMLGFVEWLGRGLGLSEFFAEAAGAGAEIVVSDAAAEEIGNDDTEHEEKE